MTAPFDRAESYRALGWTGTIPLPPAAKWPPPAGFTGDAGRWPAPDDFKRWRRGGYTTKDSAAGLLHHDAHNIALRMPPAVVGLDVDMYGQKPGRATLAGLEDKLGALPATWMTSSRDDGSGIRCYRVPPGLIWPTEAGPGIEIIRHGHRYAVAAPSLHPTTGQPYRWLGPDGTETDPPRPGDLPELPPSWVAYLTGTDAEGQPSTSRPGSRARLREAHKAGRDWLDELPDGQACTYVGTLAADCRAAATREDGNAYDHTRDAVLALLRAAERGHRGAPTVLTRTRALYVGTVAKERDTATAQGEFDRFTASGAATVLASPSDDAGRGCDCVEVTSYDGTTGPTGVAATFDGAGEGMADAMLCAQVARDVMAGRFRWARGLGWLSWTGRHWKPVPEQLVHEATRHYLLAQWRAAVKRLAQARDDEERKMLEGLVAAWRATLNKGRITSITSLTQGIAGIITDPADLDRHPDLLNAGNGVVDLRTGALGPHDPDLLLTKHTTVDYDPGARHDDWAAALRAVPADVLDWVQVRYGQAATGHMTPDDVMVVQHGGGENGKTTFAAGIRGALGDYYVEISHRALLGDPSQHPTELMSFRGARVALLEELPEERRMNVTRLKSVVGTPHMKARLIRHDEVEFAATHSLFLNTNHLPVVDETDHGTWRRLARLRFPYKFRKPGETPAAPLDRAGDPNLRQRIQEGRHGQREAALAWLVAGAVRWYAADRIMPAHPDRIADDTKEWRGKTDLLLAYADDRLIFDLDAHAMVTELLGDFNTWLKAHGHREWSDKTLTSRLEEHDEFAAHDVEKRTIRGNDRLSRPTFWDDVRTEPPGMYKAWLGLRFRQTADQWPAENRRSEPVVTAVTASSDNRLEIGLSRVIKVCGNSGNKDQQLGPPDTFAEVLARAETVELCNACGEFKDGRCTCGEPCPRCRWPAGSIGHHDDCGAEATS